MAFSYNFTSSAERDNDENLVIIDDPDLARAYLDEFARVYAQAQAPDHCQAARRSFKQPLSTWASPANKKPHQPM